MKFAIAIAVLIMLVGFYYRATVIVSDIERQEEERGQ